MKTNFDNAIRDARPAEVPYMRIGDGAPELPPLSPAARLFWRVAVCSVLVGLALVALVINY